MIKNFSETGHVIIRNAISKNLIREIQNNIYDNLKIKKKNKNKRYLKFCNIVKKLKTSE